MFIKMLSQKSKEAGWSEMYNGFAFRNNTYYAMATIDRHGIHFNVEDGNFGGKIYCKHTSFIKNEDEITLKKFINKLIDLENLDIPHLKLR